MSSPPRVQLVVSGKFIALLLLALCLLTAGYYWYTQQLAAQQHVEQIQERFKAPPYFVNRGASVVRSCSHCLETSGKLRPQSAWKMYGPQEIPATEQRWFLAVEDPPLPVTIAGVLMLPLHPALNDNPALGFDQTRVVLVLYQNLERKPWIEQPVPPPPLDTSKPSRTETGAENQGASRAADDVPQLQSPFVGDWKNVDPSTKSLTRVMITQNGDELLVHVWASCPPVQCDWGTSPGIPLPPVDGSFAISWDHKYAVHSAAVSLDPDGRLKISLQTRYQGNSGRVDLEIVSRFDRSATAP